MFRKALKTGSIVIAILVLGFGIYFFMLHPGNPYKQLKSAWKSYKLSTNNFFSTQLADENNHIQNLSQYQGKILVVNFWATWCPTCREEMPDLSEFHKENVQNNITVLGIADDEVDQVKAFVTKVPVTFPIFASKEKAMKLARGLGDDFGWLPYTIIINREGKLVKTIYGRIHKTHLQTEVDNLLAGHHNPEADKLN